ncbi:hypothetical protein [Pseudoalteromonas caenipelagi]|nr:hypothetical protein [Pseudoalteromonas caenipelagi]
MKLKKKQLKSLTQQQSSFVKGACNATVAPNARYQAQQTITEPPL